MQDDDHDEGYPGQEEELTPSLLLLVEDGAMIMNSTTIE